MLTIRRSTLGALCCMLWLSLLPALTVSADAPATDPFERTWARTDLPVAEGAISRTWMWGDEAFTGALTEPYAEAPGGQRTVQYFDKARMEDSSYRADGPPWDVTNGLLVVEMMTGQVQVGDNEYLARPPADVPVAGDPDDPDGPTYATFGTVRDAPALPIGSTIIQRIARDGTVTEDAELANYGVIIGAIDKISDHTIAEPFWEFMISTGLVYENGQYIDDRLFTPDIFATGRPVSGAYWADVLVAGTPREVLMQCFERRCLTYTPGNPDGFVVEAGNVGLHYYSWRYDLQPLALEDHGRIVMALDGDLLVLDETGVTRVTDPGNGLAFIDPRWSPDGARIVAAGRPGEITDVFDETELYVMNADGSGLEALTDQDAALSGPAWSPDGTQIAYNRVVESEIPELWILNLESGDHVLVDEGQDASWSPDGTMLLYDQSSSVWIMDLGADAGPHFVHSVLPYEYITGTDWSPDGSRIAVTNRGNAAESITPDVTILTTSGDILSSVEPVPGEIVFEPLWLDDETVAFRSAPYLLPNEAKRIVTTIYTLDLASGTATRIGEANVRNTPPGMSDLGFDWYDTAAVQ